MTGEEVMVMKKWVGLAAACIGVVLATLMLVISGISLLDNDKMVTPEGAASGPYGILGTFLFVIGVGFGLIGLISVADMLDDMQPKKVTPHNRLESNTRKRSAV